MSRRRRSQKGLLVAALAGAVAVQPAAARAHAPPLGARVLSSPNGGEEVIVTNRGLVFRDPATGASALLCNEALQITTAELPNVTLLDDGGLLVASSRGLRLSRDRGCSWEDVGGMERTNTPALAAAPGAPRTVFVASYGAERPGLRVTRDGGRTWASAIETDESDYVHSLLVAGDGGSHVYATLTSYAASAPAAHALLRSVDGGRRWERRTLPLVEAEYAALAATADPRDPAALVLYTVANSPGLDPSRLLVSEDAGDSFEVALERSEIRGAAHDAGGQLWVAARDGLWRAASLGAELERTSPASELGCVASFAGSLLVCGHYGGVDAGRSGVGVSRDGGQSFEPLLDFEHVEAPVLCEPGSLTATLCEQPWRDWEAELLAGAPGAASGPYSTPGAAPTDAVPSDAVPLDDAVRSDDAASLEVVPVDDATTDEPAPGAERTPPELGPASRGASCALGPPAQGSRARGLASGWPLLCLGCGWLRRRPPQRGARALAPAHAREDVGASR